MSEFDRFLQTPHRSLSGILTEGKSSKEIADLLFLSPKTVDVHRNNLMKKLELYTIPELTKYAIREGLTTL